MTSPLGSPKYKVLPTEKFERTLKSFIKDHYKRNEKGETLLKDLLKRFVAQIVHNPRQGVPGLGTCNPESFPNGASRPDWELWKFRFDSPGLSGGPKKGRIIYLISPENVVYLVWAYTHEEFKIRPPDTDLAKIMKGLT